MEIAIFDYMVVPTNPVGNCHRTLLANLCQEHSFTVFSVRFDNPDPKRIKWVRIPAPGRPLALLFVYFHLVAPVYYWVYRVVRRTRFDVVQGVESNFAWADVTYSHFCHQIYLSEHWTRAGSRLRQLFSLLDHGLHALMEGRVYRRSRRIVVPSHGLASELRRAHPTCAPKLYVLANPVDSARFAKPNDFDRSGFRGELGFDANDLVLVFTALGHFERKGLGLLLQATAMLGKPEVKLLVVGGSAGLIAPHRLRAQALGIDLQVVFVGMQSDVRRFLWTSDAFVFPSAYEVFSLAILEAAAAGLPLLVPRLNGAEEFVRDGKNGLIIQRTPDGIAAGITQILEWPSETRQAMGRQAQMDVQEYSPQKFSDAWRRLYCEQPVATI